MIGDSSVSTSGKVLDSDEGIKVGSTVGKVLGIIHVNLDVITLGIYVIKELESLD